MAQVLKNDVQVRILDAGLRIFSLRGFQRATMAEVAQAAGVSTGNVYRYFESKDALFGALVTPDFVDAFRGLIQSRVEALAGISSLMDLSDDSPYLTVSKELLDFSIKNRLRIVILLAQASGSCYEDFLEDLAQQLMRLAIAHFTDINSAIRMSNTLFFGLEQIYRNYVSSLGNILAKYEDETEIHQAIDDYSRYHLAGLKAYFENKEQMQKAYPPLR